MSSQLVPQQWCLTFLSCGRRSHRACVVLLILPQDATIDSECPGFGQCPVLSPTAMLLLSSKGYPPAFWPSALGSFSWMDHSCPVLCCSKLCVIGLATINRELSSSVVAELKESDIDPRVTVSGLTVGQPSPKIHVRNRRHNNRTRCTSFSSVCSRDRRSFHCTRRRRYRCGGIFYGDYGRKTEIENPRRTDLDRMVRRYGLYLDCYSNDLEDYEQRNDDQEDHNRSFGSVHASETAQSNSQLEE